MTTHQTCSCSLQVLSSNESWRTHTSTHFSFTANISVQKLSDSWRNHFWRALISFALYIQFRRTCWAILPLRSKWKLILRFSNYIYSFHTFINLKQVCPGQEYQRKLHPDDLPLRAQVQRTQRGETCHFLVRRNPNYPRRRQILPPIVEARNTSVHSINSIQSGRSVDDDDDDEGDNSNQPCRIPMSHSSDSIMCRMCKNSFKSCEFCNKQQYATSNMRRRLYQLPLSSQHQKPLIAPTPTVASECGEEVTESPIAADVKKHPASTNSIQVAPTYNPVYNIREIRTVCNSFSSLGIDKKLLDVETVQSYTNAGTIANRNSKAIAAQAAAAAAVLSKNIVVQEVVNNNPAKGYGHFVYIWIWDTAGCSL